MQFLVIAKDGNDDEAIDRRTASREHHLKYSDFAVQSGEQILGAALLDKDDNMRGSVMIVEFEDVDKLQEWLKHEPYITGNVWKDVDIIPCKIGSSFGHVLKK
jgi:uncharacterized protein YciI